MFYLILFWSFATATVWLYVLPFTIFVSFSVFNLPSKIEKKRLNSEETAMYNDDAIIVGENNESELCGSFHDSDSLSYVCQTANGELVSMNKASYHTSNQSNHRSLIPSYVLQSNTLSTVDQSTAVIVVNSETKCDINEDALSSDSNANLTANDEDKIAEIHSSRELSSESLEEKDEIGKITKLENPTYNIISHADDFDLLNPAFPYVKENALNKFTTTQSESVASSCHSKCNTMSRVTFTADQNFQDETTHRFSRTWSHKRKDAPMLLPACHCRKQGLRSNKIDPGNFFTAQSPKQTQSALIDKPHTSSDYPCDSSDPSYVIYERSRTDSYRSGDSGLPHDWSLSDDSISPPQSPDDYLFSQSRHFPNIFSQKSSYKLKASSETHVRARFSKESKNEVDFPHDLHPILSETDEPVFETDMNLTVDLRSDNTDANIANLNGQPVDADYIQVTDLCT